MAEIADLRREDWRKSDRLHIIRDLRPEVHANAKTIAQGLTSIDGLYQMGLGQGCLPLL